MPSKHRYPSTY